MVIARTLLPFAERRGCPRPQPSAPVKPVIAGRGPRAGRPSVFRYGADRDKTVLSVPLIGVFKFRQRLSAAARRHFVGIARAAARVAIFAVFGACGVRHDFLPSIGMCLRYDNILTSLIVNFMFFQNFVVTTYRVPFTYSLSDFPWCIIDEKTIS